MVRIYLLVVVVGGILGAYWCGWRVATERCQRTMINTVAQEQIKIFKIQEKVNAEVFNHGVGDIRRILRERYTISE